MQATNGGRGGLSVRNVSKRYDPKGTMLAVDNCSVEIAPGELHVVVGPSGCGKTTLLNAIAGFHSISSGEIYLDHELLCGPGKPQATPGADRVVVFQNGALFPWKTVLENITYGPVIQKRMTKTEARDRARQKMAEAGLSGLEDSYPGELSSGMARRVEIVRALVNEPKVLLLDEPFRGMDNLTKSIMHESLLEIYDRNQVTIFFITHDIEEAIFLGSRISVMTTRPGRIKESIDVDIPRPRDYRVLTSDDFRGLMIRVIDAVHDEAQKAFEAGEREMA
ncbi:MAG TPA: ABC transporter ATP-binding protein [Actinomycetota bacterium]|nr:ABC transporter ATP-binding protein [Actinomycetota bacterium]